MKNKTCLKVIPVLVVLFLLIPFASNAATAAPKTKQRIYDFAGILTQKEIKNLEAESEKCSAKRETDFVILTTNDTKGKDVMKYMEDFYDEKALGYDKPHGNCAIITVDMQHRKVYLAGFYRGEKYLDDGRLDRIRGKITPDLTKGHYYSAFHSFIRTSYEYMGIRPGVNPNNILFKTWFQIIAALATGGIVVGIMAHNSGGKVTVNESTYLDFNNSKVIEKRDDYVRTTITKTQKPSNDSSSGGSGGGGGGGISSGGNSHSGSGGSF